MDEIKRFYHFKWKSRKSKEKQKANNKQTTMIDLALTSHFLFFWCILCFTRLFSENAYWFTERINASDFHNLSGCTEICVGVLGLRVDIWSICRSSSFRPDLYIILLWTCVMYTIFRMLKFRFFWKKLL